MNLNEIEKRIFNKSDKELRIKIQSSIEWIWNETGHTGIYPNKTQIEEINSELSGSGTLKFTEAPWIGSISKQFEVISFHYLRDKYRSKAISDFMEKLETVNNIILPTSES